jgi:outer membrane usher protein
VLDGKGQEMGTAGQGGQLFVRGAEEGGDLTVRWGESESQQCRVRYQLPARAKGKSAASVVTVDATCQ